MALGLTADGSAPIQAGKQALTDPILSAATLLASGVLLKMSAVPRAKRLQKMVDVLNGGYPGLGTKTRSDFLRLAAQKPADQADQVMFDCVRASLANYLVDRTRAQMGGGMSGLGTTADVRDGFCTFAGTASILGGAIDAFNLGGSSGGQTNAIQSSSATGATIGGCNIASMAEQTRAAEAGARMAQNTSIQQLQLQQHQEQMTFQYLLLGGGGLVVATILFAVLRK